MSRTVPLFLSGAKVEEGFRSALFDAANRAGITPNEFAIVAAAEKLARCGRTFPGIFRKGDFEMVGFNPAQGTQVGGAV
ncbi:hypothetical protein D3218_01695 [Aureimonas flava]|uniref:Uncharacterized protein n=1 Tax=Aureimonas flava TaxID=2320271 RepID=A0A3A1WNM4_9HYPH|nr:hypothetical protein [Aureimonas flava]RIY03497.1 hypothetical protein D3218_01695 [Aureimonas flava]